MTGIFAGTGGGAFRAEFSAIDGRSRGGGVSVIAEAWRTAPVVGRFETGTGRREGVLAFRGTTRRTEGLPPSVRGASAEDVEEERVEGVASIRLMVGSRFVGV